MQAPHSALSVVLLVLASPLWPGGSSHAQAPGDPKQFEVVSLHLSKPGSVAATNLDLDASDYLRYSGGVVTTSGLLINYVIFAYKIADASQYPALDAQLPKWAHEEHFVLQGRPAGTPTKDEVRQMVKSVLADRFKLALHTKAASGPVYALTLEKPGAPGAQLKKASDDQLCTATPAAVARRSTEGSLAYCGLRLSRDQGQVIARMMDYTTAQIAGNLVTASRGELDPLPVVDRTGLPGRYDFQVKYQTLSRRDSSVDPASLPSEPGESFTSALRSQAGLRLRKELGEVEVYVVDHVEIPSEN